MDDRPTQLKQDANSPDFFNPFFPIGHTMSDEQSRRRINLETRHGSSREARSRKDRPCDVCRTRKSACVIAVKPPCRFCEIRKLKCTFTTPPRPRHRSTKSQSEHVEIVPTTVQIRNGESENPYPFDHVSPQASRFPVPSRDTRGSVVSSSSPQSERSRPTSSRKYLSLEQLTTVTDTTPTSQLPVPVQQLPVEKKPRELSGHDNGRAHHSLELGRNNTAHFIGLSGEQDTDLLSSIRYNVLNETKFIDFNIRRVYAGDTTTGDPPIHFSILNDAFPERDQRVKRNASDAIEAHARANGDALLRLYFRFVHPVLPVLSKAGTLMAYAADKLSIPASLRGVIYGLACAFWTQDPSLKDTPPIAQADFFEHAHAALNRELDSPKLSTLQTCLLILHEQPDVSGTTESPRIWVLACQATACAQSLGLHQDPSSWKLPLWEKRLRKRLWWITYVHDIWTSICHGNTPHLQQESFDTTELSMADLASDEHVVGLPGCHLLEGADQDFQPQNAARFMEILKLTTLLSRVLGTYTVQKYRQTAMKKGPELQEASIWNLKIELDRTLSTLPQSLAFGPSTTEIRTTRNLHLAFFAVKFLILRQLMAPATPESKSDPTSKLCQHFPLALFEGEAFVQFMQKFCSTDLHTFWPRHCRANLIIGGNHLTYLFFCASTESQVAKAYELLQTYQEILTSAAKNSDWTTIGLIRPSLLRTDSFFHGAAEGIRLSGLK